MEKEFVTYEQALALKELGFDEPCWGYCDSNREFQFFADIRVCNTNSEFRFYPTTPTFSQAFRWFRDKHDLLSWIEDHTETNFIYEIRPHILSHYTRGEKYAFKTYEEAESTCLDKLIEIIKTK